MGGGSSSQQQAATYNNLTNKMEIKASNEFVNSAVMDSIKKTILQISQNCTQKFDSNSILQISNISSSGPVSISGLRLDSKSIVQFECINESSIITQVEDKFMSDNSSTMTTMLQSVGNVDFISNISGSLKSKLDSMPLSYSSSSSSSNNTNNITTSSAVQVMQSIQNLYKSTSVNETTTQIANDIFQSFKKEAVIKVMDISSNSSVSIDSINLTTLDKFESTAKLAASIGNIIIQKMESILGMDIEFTQSSVQTTSGESSIDTNTTSEVTSETAAGVVNNAIAGITSVLNTPKVIFLAVAGVVLVIGLVIVIVYYLKTRKVKGGCEVVDKLLNSGTSFTQDDTLYMLRNIL